MRMEKSDQQIEFACVKFKCSHMSADSNREEKPQRSCSAMKFILFRLWLKSYLQHGAHTTRFFPKQNLPSPSIPFSCFFLSPANLPQQVLPGCSPPPPPAFTLFCLFFAPTQEGEWVYMCLHVYMCARFLFFFFTAAAVYPAHRIHLVSFCLQSEVLNTLTNAILRAALNATVQLYSGQVLRLRCRQTLLHGLILSSLQHSALTGLYYANLPAGCFPFQ